VTVRWGRREDIVWIQIRKRKTAARKGDKGDPVWPQPEKDRSALEKEQECAEESRKAIGYQTLDRGLINRKAKNFSLRHLLPDRSWRLSKLPNNEFLKSNVEDL
jgi:hypothetical protein